jgi:hypothetical protein
MMLFAKRTTPMKKLLLAGVVGLAICASASAEIITNGLSLSVAGRVMESAGYKQTGLDMLPVSSNNDLQLQYWRVGEGLLIIEYSQTSKAVLGLEFFLCDERPKAFRKTFDFEVTSFDAQSGLMTIKAHKGEPGGPANRSQPVRPETNATLQANGPRR